MSIDTETVLTALVAHVSQSVVVKFVANAAVNSNQLTGVSNLNGLFAGIPVFGPGLNRGATILALDPVARTITVSALLTADSNTGSFSTGFLTTGRRVKLWREVEAQPALFIRHTADDDTFSGGGLGMTEVEAEMWIYSKAGSNPDATPDTGLNNLVRMIRASFAPDDDSTGEFTLGHLVYRCRIEGQSMYDPGDLDGQAKAVIPVKILLP